MYESRIKIWSDIVSMDNNPLKSIHVLGVFQEEKTKLLQAYELKWKTIGDRQREKAQNHLVLSTCLHSKIGYLWLLDFSKTKIAFERELWSFNENFSGRFEK